MSKMEQVAKDYQELDREIKALQAKQKPLKTALLKYAEGNKSKFDEAFQLKFPNGTFVVLRVKDAIIGDKEDRLKLLEYNNDFQKIDLDEKAVLEQVPKDDLLRKFLTKNSLKVGQKETLAIYAG